MIIYVYNVYNIYNILNNRDIYSYIYNLTIVIVTRKIFVFPYIFNYVFT